MTKAIMRFAVLLLTFLALAGLCLAEGSDGTITIVYTNDIHSYVDNTKTVTAEDGTTVTVPGLRLSNIAKMVEDMRDSGMDVLLVDAGDEVQGNSLGSIDEGITVIDIMNAAGYQLATPGNHDFDYGMFQFFHLVDEAQFPYITCNFHADPSASAEQPFEASKIFELGRKKVAFIGISTPETLTSSTPTYFQDSSGAFIYSFDGTEKPEDLYESVQKAIDDVRDEADIVIALGHVGMGMDEKRSGISSADIIQHTSGLDAFIDGHSHTEMEGELVADRDGKNVLLTQTGCYLNAVGVMEIAADGTITTKLVKEYEGTDEKVAALEDQLAGRVDEELGTRIAVLDTALTVNDPDNDGRRLIRAVELNAGDFFADTVYWYFNEFKGMDCDIALANGGGIRASVAAGPVTKTDIKNVLPFGNVVCLISATGSQIRDALEAGVTVTGVYDAQWDAPMENGGFMQVAGMRYTVDPSVPTSVVTDDSGMFSAVSGAYRVRDIEIYNRKTGSYEPIDPDKTYTVGGINYLLRNGGNGLSMFQNCQAVVDYVGQDCDVACAYIASFASSGEYPEIKTANSPLAGYAGYQLDYENPYGAGRITILDNAE